LLPVSVSGLSGITAITLGDAHACALTNQGTVQCWGDNSVGELGNGSTVAQSSTPVTVSGLSGIKAIAAGGSRTCALSDLGTVQCWGDNDEGQLGNGSVINYSSVPVAVSGLSGIVAISGGAGACALTGQGFVYCWGPNDVGELGIGSTSTTSSSVPVMVPGLSGVTAIAMGSLVSCAIVGTTSVQCWGFNLSGQLGNSSAAPHQFSPIAVSVISVPLAIAPSFYSTCFLSAQHVVECWGNNLYGQLGNGSTVNSLTPVNPVLEP
jgi:hypothetical protein